MGDCFKFRGLLRKPELYVRPNVCSTCRLRPLWKSAVFRAGNVVSDVGCHIFPLKLQIAEPGTRSCAFSHWDSGAQRGQNNFGITFLYFSITFVWHLSVDFWGQGSTGSRLCLKISFWRKFFFYLTFTDIQRNNGNNSENKGFRKIKSIKQWKTQKIVLLNEYF